LVVVDVLCASSAEEARAIVEREFVDVIFADQRMPGTTWAKRACASPAG